MGKINLLVLTIALTAAQGWAKSNDVIDGVQLLTTKDKSQRSYKGTVSKVYPADIVTLKAGIVNFGDKCNNSFAEKRVYTDKKSDCRYHNDNLIESFVIKTINKDYAAEANEKERYILGRLAYNRGTYQHYELVKTFEYKNELNQKTIKIVTKMLSDKEVSKYIKPAFKKDSAFNETLSTYTLTEVGKNETRLDYEYFAETDHWLLNKEISIPQVFSSMSKSINNFLDTVTTEPEASLVSSAK